MSGVQILLRFKKISVHVGNIVVWNYYYCPVEVILLFQGGMLFGPEMLPEATEEKVVNQHGVQWAIFQQIFINQWPVSLSVIESTQNIREQAQLQAEP